ncbi:NADH dehydrogenase [Bacteroides luti]|uniref:NADH:ubiquinone reductase (non-electrogenic) n=1 Tax=Bacteroides luti TaxID=1297750 RepID=A0A1M5BDQ2_9BACE|nr:NAD(P)/FAD-dependent oxidoreductase [Bacteroides luti]SHF40649.1 NADH dehydrogenase [Bacteroides luti]
MDFNVPSVGKKRVVIVGGGFGGLKLANKLCNSGFQVVLVDRNNYHQFLPMIYEVASAGLEPSSIAFPFRKIFQKRKDFYFRWADVTGVNAKENLIETSIGKLKYDYLVIASGTETNYFGNQNIEDVALPMKTVEEAMSMRNILLANLERSLTTADLKERQALQNIVIVGGGATGVEVSGALSEMKRFVIPKDYPEMEVHKVNIYLIEATPKLLSAMSPQASANAEKFLRGMGVNVMLNTLVQDYREGKVILDNGMDIPTRNFIWVSGVTGTSFDNIGSEFLGRGRRIKVDEHNKVIGLDNVFAIGDVCIMTAEKDYPNGHPQLAQVAIQQGDLLASNLKNMEKGKKLKPFHYRNLGSLATVGRNKAVADFNQLKMHGWFAWIIWLVIHLRSILGIRNKVMVLVNWVWGYLTYDKSIRLIMAAKRVKRPKGVN